MITPPVEAVILESRPSVTVSSRTLKNFSAMACLFSMNAFARSRSSFLCSTSAFFMAVLLGVFAEGLVVVFGVTVLGKVSLSLNSSSESESSNSRSRSSILHGECWSIQLLVFSWLQNASTLSRCGVGGMWAFSLVGDRRLRPFVGLDRGVSSLTLLLDGSFLVGTSTSSTLLLGVNTYMGGWGSPSKLTHKCISLPAWALCLHCPASACSTFRIFRARFETTS